MLGHYNLIDSVIFIRGLWTTKQGLKANWPSSWRLTDTLSWRSLILLLSLHEAYLTNYDAYRVIHHLMDPLFCLLSFSCYAHEKPGSSLEYRLQALCFLMIIQMNTMWSGPTFTVISLFRDWILFLIHYAHTLFVVDWHTKQIVEYKKKKKFFRILSLHLFSL